MMRSRARVAITWLLSAALLEPFSHAGCGKKIDDGTRPVAPETTTLELRDDTPDVLITWIDEKGDHHVVQHPGDVPREARELVRVESPTVGGGEQLAVADLSRKREDGTYAVRGMSRSEWELVAERRRNKTMAAAPRLADSATSPSRPGTTSEPGQAGLRATLYGASWCNACRQAQDYLRQRGIHVTMRDIEKDPGAKPEMDRKLRNAGLPVTGSIPVVDLQGRLLTGFDRSEYERAIRSLTARDEV